MSLDHTNDSPTTRQRKSHWRAAKFAEKIWKEHGFDTTIDDTLIKSWVKPIWLLLDDDNRPILTYVEPPSDGYWDILISPNSKFFSVFEPFDLSLPDDQRLTLEFKRLNHCHAKHGTTLKNIWSNDRPLELITSRNRLTSLAWTPKKCSWLQGCSKSKQKNIKKWRLHVKS